MRDASYLIAVVGVLFLIVAGFAWSRIIRKPDEEPPTESNARRSSSAAMIVVIAFLLCAAAALIALLGMFQR